TDEPSSSQEAQENKSLEKDVAIDKKLESLKSELDKMKEKFSIVKKNELELREKLKDVEDLLQNFKEKSFTEHFNPAGDANQSQTSGEKLVDQLKATGIDKPPSSQETTQEKKSEDEGVPIDEKLDSLKSVIDITKAKFSAVKKNEEVLDMLRATKDLLQNFNAKGSAEIVEPAQDSKENDTKGQ
ncbi:uncharacterized protein LOC109794764, partial [Cajanus cajan]|uniref:uncharacterized protein LOC109794764 n=1 Tax=Cajanus cajan TaxID=3821 RepID=UPI00098DB82F